MVVTSASLASEQWHEDPAFEPLTYERVIGLNNLLSVAWLSRGLELAATVARIALPGGPGTGFLIGPDLVITNHHVLPNEKAAEKAVVEFNYQINWAGRPEPVRRFSLDTSYFHTNKALDYTIVRVQGTPGDLFGHIDLVDRAEVNVNDYVIVIGHPNGGPKQIGLTDNKVAAVFDTVVQYSTDTEPGSSGSPVFNQDWRLVGLHHRGGGLAGPDGQKYFINEGVQIGAIVRDAAAFLGLPDLLYDLSFMEMRSALVNLVERSEPPTDPNELAKDLIRTQPRLAFTVEDWCQMRIAPEEDPLAVVSSAGVAIGGALRHWARTEGHESIRDPTTPAPPPAQPLLDLFSSHKGSDETPAHVYNALLSALGQDRALVSDVVSAVGERTPTVALVQAFLQGVVYGVAAYEGATAGSPPRRRDG